MKNFQRPLAIAALILIALLLIAALVLAIIGTETALRLLTADLFCLIVVPAVVYGYQVLFHTKKK